MTKPDYIEKRVLDLEKAVRESEERFSGILSITSDAIIMVDKDHRIIFFNKGAEKIFGFPVSEVMGQPLDLLIPQRFSEKHKDHIRSFNAETVTFRLKRNRGSEIIGRRKDGSEFPVEASISKWKKNGETVFTAILRNMAVRKEAEKVLEDEKEQLLVTLSSIGDGVITTDSKSRVLLMNWVAETLTGWNQAEAIGKPLQEVFQIFNEKSREPVANPVVQHPATGSIMELANHTFLRSKDGIERNIAGSGAPIRDQEGNTFGVVLVFRDVTGQQRMREEVLKATKLESIGYLAGGIVHDFNNILTAIMGNLSLAKMELDSHTSSYLRLAETERAAKRAKDLASQLLTFSKRVSPRKRVISLVELLKDSAHFALRGSNVRPEFYFSHHLREVEIDEGQINQVVHNLVINAQQAMPEGGVILISAENLTIEAKLAEDLRVTPGNFISIAFKDTGKGIPKENLSKLFEPFFTTKEKGSGLGLFSSYSIIKNHDGAITVTSEEGIGTTFSVYLPATLEAQTQVKEVEKEIYRGSGRILVLDDDEMVRKVAGAMLESLGYEVAYASTGEEAIQIYKKEKLANRSFDALILDLTLPGGVGGREIFQKLMEFDPGLKGIISSGYSQDPVMVNYKEFGFKKNIAKPYQVQELSRVLHQVLNS